MDEVISSQDVELWLGFLDLLGENHHTHDGERDTWENCILCDVVINTCPCEKGQYAKVTENVMNAAIYPDLCITQSAQC